MAVFLEAFTEEVFPGASMAAASPEAEAFMKEVFGKLKEALQGSMPDRASKSGVEAGDRGNPFILVEATF